MPIPARTPTARSFSSPKCRTPHLNGSYTIFGQCDDASVALVKQIARMAADPSNDKPFRPVKITHIKHRSGHGHRCEAEPEQLRRSRRRRRQNRATQPATAQSSGSTDESTRLSARATCRGFGNGQRPTTNDDSRKDSYDSPTRTLRHIRNQRRQPLSAASLKKTRPRPSPTLSTSPKASASGSIPRPARNRTTASTTERFFTA